MNRIGRSLDEARERSETLEVKCAFPPFFCVFFRSGLVLFLGFRHEAASRSEIIGTLKAIQYL